MIDRQNVLMEDGDFVLFGTHRHGVPLMPYEQRGRISLVLFFQPQSPTSRLLGSSLTCSHVEINPSDLKCMR